MPCSKGPMSRRAWGAIMVSASLTDAKYGPSRAVSLADSPMLIVCPNCSTSYRVEGAALGSSGRSVRCVRCRHVWFAHDPEALAAIAQAHRAEVEAIVGADTTSAAVREHVPAASEPDNSEEQPATSAQPAEAEIAPPILPSPSLMAAQEITPDVTDGQSPVVTIDAPPLGPGEAPSRPPRGEDIETVAARRESVRAKRRQHTTLIALSLAILAVICLDTALITGRARVVKAAPQTASLYAALGLPVNLRGLSFDKVVTSSEIHDGVQVLVVEGSIINSSSRIVEVPRLRFSVRNKTGQEIYTWTSLPGQTMLSPGESLPFRSRLASPPPEMADLLVRFFHRRDLVVGAR